MVTSTAATAVMATDGVATAAMATSAVAAAEMTKATASLCAVSLVPVRTPGPAESVAGTVVPTVTDPAAHRPRYTASSMAHTVAQPSLCPPQRRARSRTLPPKSAPIRPPTPGHAHGRLPTLETCAERTFLAWERAHDAPPPTGACAAFPLPSETCAARPYPPRNVRRKPSPHPPVTCARRTRSERACARRPSPPWERAHVDPPPARACARRPS